MFDASGKLRDERSYGYSGGEPLFRPGSGTEFAFLTDSVTLYNVGARSALRPPWPSTHGATWAAWSRDGTKIVRLEHHSDGAHVVAYARASGKVLFDHRTEMGQIEFLGDGNTVAVSTQEGFELLGIKPAVRVEDSSAAWLFSLDGARRYSVVTKGGGTVLRVRSAGDGSIEREVILPLLIDPKLAMDERGRWLAVHGQSTVLMLGVENLDTVASFSCPSYSGTFLEGGDRLVVSSHPIHHDDISMVRPSAQGVLHFMVGHTPQGAPLRLVWSDAGAFEADAAPFLAVRRSSNVRARMEPVDVKAATSGMIGAFLDGR
jgi:hypothetical protein